MPVKIKKLELEKGRRILVTGDIHGHLALLESLLGRAGFCERDYLFIIGDIVEKGPDSLGALRRVMKLSERDNVTVLTGNVDAWRVSMLDRLNNPGAAESFYKYLIKMRKWKGTSLFDEMARETSLAVDSPDDVLAVKARISSHFKAEYDFLRSLPAVAETQKYIFTHAGLPSADLDSLRDKKLFDVLKIDNFLSLGLSFDKFVIVGHWPVTLYGEKIAQANPVINRERSIISIDGGCGLKRDGQLNLLIIPELDCPPDYITSIYADGLPIVTAIDSQDASSDSINIRWLDNKIRILERGEHFTLAEHISSGYRLKIYNKYIGDISADITYTDDFTDYMLPVSPGDALSLLYETPEGHIVKKKGVSGWYHGRISK